MKTKLLLLVLLVVSFYACQKDEVSSQSSSQMIPSSSHSTINSKDISGKEDGFEYGNYHNSLCEYFIDNTYIDTLLGIPCDEERLGFVIEKLREKVILEIGDEQGIMDQVDDVRDFILNEESFWTLSTGELVNDNLNFQLSALNNAYAENIISSDLLSALTDLIEESEEMSAYEYKTAVQDIKNMTWSQSDEDVLSILVDVTNKSYVFWYEELGNDDPMFWLTSGGRAVAMDGFGALHGLIFGPVGSIIEGTVFSLAATEGWFY